MLIPDPLLLSEVKNIQALRSTVSLIRDTPQPAAGFGISAVPKRVGRFVRLLSNLRFCLRPIGDHDWIIAYDGSRNTPEPSESGYDFITRVCKTNRDTPLTDILRLAPQDRYRLVDMARQSGGSARIPGTLAFLFSLVGVTGLGRFIVQIATGYRGTRSAQGAFLYAALDTVRRRHTRTAHGLWLTTSTTWLAEVLRTGLSGASEDLKIIEVLHGASTKNIAPYFQWLHTRTKADLIYVNLIADLPRFYPQSAHLLRDEMGEIACNIRLWQENPEGALHVSRDRIRKPAIAIIGGASTDKDYSKSSYFAKEVRMIKALQRRLDIPMRYCVHPKHKGDQRVKLTHRIEATGIHIAPRSTQAETIEARIVVGGLSTSLIEAALLGRPTFAYEDLGSLFIPEVAELVTYGDDMDTLSEQVAELARCETVRSVDDVLKTVSDQAQKRYGLKLIVE